MSSSHSPHSFRTWSRLRAWGSHYAAQSKISPLSHRCPFPKRNLVGPHACPLRPLRGSSRHTCRSLQTIIRNDRVATSEDEHCKFTLRSSSKSVQVALHQHLVHSAPTTTCDASDGTRCARVTHVLVHHVQTQSEIHRDRDTLSDRHGDARNTLKQT